MHTIDIPEKNITTEIPSCWDELTRDQLLYSIELAIMLEKKQITILDYKIRMLYYFLDIKRTGVQDYKDNKLTDNEKETKYSNIYLLTDLLDYFFREEKHGKKYIMVWTYDSINNHFPVLDKYYGPDDALINISFAEFRTAMSFYAKFNQDKKEDHLNSLVAVLYRPEIPGYESEKLNDDFDGQRRVKFNIHQVERRAAEISKISYTKRYAVYLFFRNCVQHIMNNDIVVDNNKICFGVLFRSNEAETESPGLGLTGTLYKLADAGTFGSIRETDEAGLYDVLLKLYQWKLEYDEFKRKNKKHDTG